MAYEIDFIGVKETECKKDADAICLRWKSGKDYNGNDVYTVGVVDGGFEAHGQAMVRHMNEYYFNDAAGRKAPFEKIVDFVVVTHPDSDHTTGLKVILENFNVQNIYMNRPWLYIDFLFPFVDDGRITKSSLKERLYEKYSTIVEIEAIALAKRIQILDAFQGTIINNKIDILSPSKKFYINLLLESEKTPLQNKGLFQQAFDTYTRYTESVKALFETWFNEELRENVSTSAENESSVVLFGLDAGQGFLLTGDAGIRALTEALDYANCNGKDISSDLSFYQMPHHGSRHNVSPSVLNRMLGKVVPKDEKTGKTAFSSVAEKSDHPLKMVTNAYIRRGVTTYKTQGATICHKHGNMPDRGWTKMNEIQFSPYVEDWDD